MKSLLANFEVTVRDLPHCRMSDKGISLPVFNGKYAAFQVWWTKFRAFATAKGFVQALLTANDLPGKEDEVLDPSNDVDKTKIKARERNSLAMAYLFSAFKAEADISLRSLSRMPD